jgi:glycosyltransferase involved in cell wall biosynthesis
VKALVITIGDKNAGSTKFRIMQYIPFLQENGFSFDFVSQKDLHAGHLRTIRDYDLVINQKSLLKTSTANEIIAKSRRLIFDFDDAIYTRPGKPYSWLTQWRVNRRFKMWLKGSHTIITANQFLKSQGSKYSADIHVLPMALDLEIWMPGTPNTHYTIGWAGAPVNLHHLERLEPVLNEVLKRHPHVRLAVYSGVKPKLHIPYEYIPFEPGKEHQFTQSIDVGLLPLTDEEYSRGKSPIKAIQYIACGVPVVGNIFGATAEILNERNSISVKEDSEWCSALHYLITHQDHSKEMGKAGRKYAEKHFSLHSVKHNLLKLMKGT